jgi:hypothetical protein
MRCHFAFGREQGGQDMKACPIYLPDLRFEAASDGRSVMILSATTAAVAELRRRARTHVARE